MTLCVWDPEVNSKRSFQCTSHYLPHDPIMLPALRLWVQEIFFCCPRYFFTEFWGILVFFSLFLFACLATIIFSYNWSLLSLMAENIPKSGFLEVSFLLLFCSFLFCIFVSCFYCISYKWRNLCITADCHLETRYSSVFFYLFALEWVKELHNNNYFYCYNCYLLDAD